MTTIQEHIDSTPSENPNPSSKTGILPIAFLMLFVGVIWRIIDVMVLNLGDTWLNIMPSKIGPLVIMIAVLWKLYGNEDMRSTLGLVKVNFRTQFLVGILLGVSFYLCIDVLGSIVYHTIVNPSYDLTFSIYNPELLWYAFIFFFVNAVFEETLFRGLLQNSFKTRVSVNKAILFSALIFGVWHAVWPIVNGAPLSEYLSMIILSGILGAFFGVYYEKFSSGKTLYGTITCHTLINFLNESFKIGADESTQGPDFVFSDPVFLLISVVIFFTMIIIYFGIIWRTRVESVEDLGHRIGNSVKQILGK